MDRNASLHSTVPTTLLAYVCAAQKGVGSKNQIKMNDKIYGYYIRTNLLQSIQKWDLGSFQALSIFAKYLETMVCFEVEIKCFH